MSLEVISGSTGQDTVCLTQKSVHRAVTRYYAGITALHHACSESVRDAVAEVITLCPDYVNARYHMVTWSRSPQSLYQVLTMMLFEFHFHAHRDLRGRTPLHVLCERASAASEETNEIAERLLAAGALVNARDKFGQTPIHLLCARAPRGSLAVAQTLAAFGADLYLADHEGVSVLSRALQSSGPGSRDLCSFLVDLAEARRKSSIKLIKAGHVGGELRW